MVCLHNGTLLESYFRIIPLLTDYIDRGVFLTSPPAPKTAWKTRLGPSFASINFVQPLSSIIFRYRILYLALSLDTYISGTMVTRSPILCLNEFPDSGMTVFYCRSATQLTRIRWRKRFTVYTLLNTHWCCKHVVLASMIEILFQEIHNTVRM